jgi:hypothetical protein
LPFVGSKFNIPDTVGDAPVPAVRLLVVMTGFWNFLFKRTVTEDRYREHVRGIKISGEEFTLVTQRKT